MAYLSNLAILYKIPIALFCILLTPIAYIFSRLLSDANKLQRCVLGDRTNTQAFTSRNSQLLCNQENKKLFDAWSASATSKIIFVTIEVRLQDIDQPDISEIALSWWSPGTENPISALLWVIEVDGRDAREHRAYKMLGFETMTLKADEISTHLAEKLQLFRSQSKRIYLVGYKINQTLGIIRNSWAKPQDIETIDTGKVWQAQYQSNTEMSFKECIESIPHLRRYSSSLENTESKARLGIQLLQVQVEGFR